MADLFESVISLVLILLYRKTYSFKMDKANTKDNSLRKTDDEKRIFHGDRTEKVVFVEKENNQCV